jgi:hypothetical protein
VSSSTVFSPFYRWKVRFHECPILGSQFWKFRQWLIDSIGKQMLDVFSLPVKVKDVIMVLQVLGQGLEDYPFAKESSGLFPPAKLSRPRGAFPNFAKETFRTARLLVSPSRQSASLDQQPPIRRRSLRGGVHAELGDRLSIGKAFQLADEINNVAAFMTAVAIEDALVFIDCERRSFLGVKRAESSELFPGAAQGKVLADDLDY